MRDKMFPMPAYLELNGPYSRRYYGGGDAPQQTSTTTVNQLYSPEEAAQRAALMAEAQRIYGQTSGIAGSQGAPAPSADTLKAQQMLRGVAQNNDWSAMADQLRQQQTIGFNALADPTSAPGFQSSLNTALRRVGESYTDPNGVFSQIRSGYTGENSGGSGTREGIAMGLAGRSYLNTVGDVTGKFTADAYKGAQDMWARTLGLAPQTMAAVQGGDTASAGLYSALGQQTEAYDQAKRDWQLQAPWAAMGPYANVVMGMSNPSTQTTSSVPGPRANPAAPLGMALTGASIGAMAGGPVGAGIGAGAGLVLSLFK